MSDQRMNAGDQGTQPDSGSAPNDQVSVSAQGGKHRSAPESAGSQPARTESSINDEVQDSDGGEGGGYDPRGRDNIDQIKG
jgi:hypothetical protein